VDHKNYRNQFNCFSDIESVQNFHKESELSYPRDTFKGLSSRLEYNGKTRKNYMKYYKGMHRRAVS
jgi:hypothetical protein